MSCLGLGGGARVSSADVLYAYGRGINFFFYSADLHHGLYSSMAEALKTLCGRSSAERQNVVLAVVTYVNRPRLLPGVLYDVFKELCVDYVDLLFWGCVGDEDRIPFGACMQQSRYLRGPRTPFAEYVETVQGTSADLRRLGAVRYTGASFHSLDCAQEWIGSSALDAMMLRYNVAHRRAKSRLLDKVPTDGMRRQGMITFKSTGAASGALWRPPRDFPTDRPVPTAPTLYRYALSEPATDVCLAAWKSRAEVDEAIRGVQLGPVTPAERNYLDIYGDVHRGRRGAAELPALPLESFRDGG